jgi:phage terminase small subunit
MKLQHKVHAFLDKINLKTYENVILSTYSTLVVLRYIHEEDGATKHGEEVNNNKQWDQGFHQLKQRIQEDSVRTTAQTSLETKNHRLQIRIQEVHFGLPFRLVWTCIMN